MIATFLCIQTAHTQQLEYAERIAVETHAKFLVATEDNHAVNWYNLGETYGTFGDFGFDGPLSQYPIFKEVDGFKALSFDGDDWLKMDLKAPEGISDQDFSVEVWAFNPSVEENETLISWAMPQDREHGISLNYGTNQENGAIMYGKALNKGYGKDIPEAGKWHHLVLTYNGNNGGTETLYVDGKEVFSRSVELNLSKEGTIYLGCDGEQKNHFSGALAAVRIHKGTLSGKQVVANHQGGIDLGTQLLPNIIDDPRGSTFADPSKEEGLICRSSEHFRVCWFEDKDEQNVMPERVPEQLEQAERYYEIYNRELAMFPPIVSSKKENRGDGKKYKIEICTNWSGGNFGGNIPSGFGYPIQGPGYISGHELVHAYQMHFMGSCPGNWWEVHANWVPTMADRPHVNAVDASMATAPLYPAHGRNYYHSYLIYKHLADTEEYGPRFIAKLWHTNPNPEVFHWNTAREIDPDPSTPIIDEWAKMARRNITWEYDRQKAYQEAARGKKRNAWVVLEPIPYQNEWHRVSKEMAPMQFGWNIVPLEITDKKVTAELSGYDNPQRGSDWRASFVAVDKNGSPRYSKVFGQRAFTFTLEPEDEKLFLAVVATPEKLMNPQTTTDNRAPAAEKFRYKLKFEGAKPIDYAKTKKPDVAGQAHPNGEGFVAETAQVDASAWVGPNAQVLGKAKVMDQARIEDYAVVKDEAVVKDHARVYGHAQVSGTMEGYARAGGFAKITRNAVARDHALVLEHATLTGRSTLTGYATAKGYAAAAGDVSGTTICDGSYAKNNQLSQGIWTTWSWGGGKNAGDLDKELSGLYAQYRFEKDHPFYAWDTYGLTHGLKMGEPEIILLPDRIQFSHQAESVTRLNSFETPKNEGDRYASQICGYLNPPENGSYTFTIDADDDAELWLSTNEKRSNRRLIASTQQDQTQSEAVHLHAGQPYYIEALHKEGGGPDHLKVEWASGNIQKTVIPGKYLSTKHDGETGSILRKKWTGIRGHLVDQMMTSHVVDLNKVQAQGNVLQLNGQDQFVELPHEMDDMRDFSIDINLKWQDNTNNQRIIEFYRDARHKAYLTPSDDQGKLAFVMENGDERHVLQAHSQLPSYKWVNLKLVMDGDKASLYLNEEKVAENLSFTINLEDIGSKVNYLGRGHEGSYFKALIEEFSFYRVPVIDEQAPAPDPAGWAIQPLRVSPHKAVMQAKQGQDPLGIVEYNFKEITGNQGGDDSGWQRSPSYTDLSLKKGKKYAYRVMMRDANGNITKPSNKGSAEWTNPKAFKASEKENHLIEMEAENYHRKNNGTVESKWALSKEINGYSGKGSMLAIPDEGVQVNTGYSEKSPRLDYVVEFRTAGKYFLWIRGTGSNPSGDSMHAGLDLKEEDRGTVITVDKGKYSWKKHPKTFEMNDPGIHTLSLWMREDGVAVDKIILTTNPDYTPKN